VSSRGYEDPAFSSATRRKLTAVDLFCGCGGTTVGLKNAGFRVVGAVDNDPLAIQTYSANHPRVKVWTEDIRQLQPLEVAAALGIKPGELDLLAGCPPCQGFSTMRTRNGAVRIDDPRNDLLLEFQRFVEELKPRAVMIENVPGLAQDACFAVFCRNMKDLGYLGDPEVLNTANYGVPQRRRRLIYLAGRGLAIALAAPSRQKKTVREAIGGLPKAGESGDPVHDLPEERSARIRGLISRIPKDGGSRSDLGDDCQLDCHKRCDGFKDVYGRMAWDDVAPTITSGCFNPSKGRFLHPEEDRAITMREAALLQGFPPRYRWIHNRKSAVALMIGNALPPPFIAAHARCVAGAIRDADALGTQCESSAR
jgi:DNA (cytosine-5)-methyltransferase 1